MACAGSKRVFPVVAVRLVQHPAETVAERAIARTREPVHHLRDKPLAVDRAGHRLARRLVREGRALHVEHQEIDRGDVDPLAILQRGVPHQPRLVRFRQVEIHHGVDLARLEPAGAIGGLRHDLEHHRVEARLAAPPGTVALEPDRAAALPSREFVRAGADRRLVRRIRRDVARRVEMLRQDRRVEHRELRQERRIALLQREHDRAGIRRLYVGADVA